MINVQQHSSGQTFSLRELNVTALLLFWLMILLCAVLLISPTFPFQSTAPNSGTIEKIHEREKKNEYRKSHHRPFSYLESTHFEPFSFFQIGNDVHLGTFSIKHTQTH